MMEHAQDIQNDDESQFSCTTEFTDHEINGNNEIKNSTDELIDINMNTIVQSTSRTSITKAEWVRLNIGGQYFVTTRTTLCKNEKSFFYKLCKEESQDGLSTDKDDNGAFLIDRDAQYFLPILNYLRHGKLIIENNLNEEGVLEEAEFYNIPDLISLVKERIKAKNDTKSTRNVKRIYRVIQLKESEITQMLSTMSDGWQFEQIMNVGSHHTNYAHEDRSEFLLIVSKEYNGNFNDIGIEGDAGSDKRKKIVQNALH